MKNKLAPYSYRGWNVYHFLKGDRLPEQFYGYRKGYDTIICNTKSEIEDKIDRIIEIENNP